MWKLAGLFVILSVSLWFVPVRGFSTLETTLHWAFRLALPLWPWALYLFEKVYRRAREAEERADLASMSIEDQALVGETWWSCDHMESLTLGPGEHELRFFPNGRLEVSGWPLSYPFRAGRETWARVGPNRLAIGEEGGKLGEIDYRITDSGVLVFDEEEYDEDAPDRYPDPDLSFLTITSYERRGKEK